MNRTRRIAVFLPFALVAVLALTVVISMSAHWRARAVVLALSGDLREVTWSQLGSALVPKAWRSDESLLETGFVTLERRALQEPCEALWNTPVGQLWGRMGDEPALEFLIIEELILRIYEHGPVTVRNRDIVLDAGSHLGVFTALALRRGAARVVAFEPEPVNIECFKKSFADEILQQKVVLVEAAVWESSGTLNFETAHNPTSLAGGVDPAGALLVRAVTIDQTVAALTLDSVDFIKMDIEGAERHALTGARETLARYGPRMALCVYHREDDPVVVPTVVLAARPSYRSIETDHQVYFIDE